MTLKTEFLEKMNENKLEFPGGEGGVQNQKPSMGGVWILSGTAKYKYCVIFLLIIHICSILSAFG